MPDNPAQHLHDMMAALKSQPGNAIVVNAIATVLEVDSTDLPTLLYGAAELAELPKQIETELVAIPDLNQELYLTWKPAVRAALDYLKNMAGQNMQAMGAHYNDTTLLSLRHASDVLRASSYRDIPSEQLQNLLVSIDELRQLIEESDEVDGVLQAFLLDLVEEMRRSIRLYRIHGASGIEKALERSVGALWLRYQRTSTPPPASGKVWKKFAAVLAAMGLVLTTANSAYELGSNVVEGIAQIAAAGADGG